MKALISILILVLAAVVTVALVIFQPDVEAISPERPVTNVETITVQPEAVRVIIRSQGIVLPRTETNLSPEVSGRVIEISDNLQVGKRFSKGEILLRIDPADYEVAVTARSSELATARLALAQEVALTEQASKEWKRLGGDEPASPLTLREPQMARAEALVAAAEAALAQARRRLDDTQVKAPYDGRVLTRVADIGQYVTPNPAAPAARIYATARAEVRLPVTLRDAAFLEPEAEPSPVARLYPDEPNGGQATWTGRLTRMEGVVDPRTRLLYAVVELDTDLGHIAKSDSARVPIRRGQFVQAEVEGRLVENAYRLPRYALRDSDTLYIVSEEGHLQSRQVEIVRTDASHVIISDGLQPGEQVAVSPVAYFIEDMPVEVISEQ